MLTPPFFHWYVGVVPPFAGVAVNITDVPEQIAPAGFADILTLAVTLGSTVMVIPVDVAGDPLTHVALEVMVTVMTSPLARVVVV